MLAELALFGMMSVPTGTPQTLVSWHSAMNRMQADRAAVSECIKDVEACPSVGIAAWVAMLKPLVKQSRTDQIGAVNALMNRLPYECDAVLYGGAKDCETEFDYWATPLEFLTNGGDCEDYAIAKYVSLRMLGVPDEDMLITVGWSQEQGAHHAVLVVDADPDENGALPVVLNNVTNVVTLDADLAVEALAPLFSVNMTSKVGHF